MKWISVYLLGYALLVTGGLLALWKGGLLETIDPAWTAIAVVILTGLGVMFAVANTGDKKLVEVDSN